MSSVNAPILGFQGGILGKYLWGRVDVPAYAKSCEIMDNWRPWAQGPMARRPPMEYIDSFTDHNQKGTLFPFVFSTEQSYLVLGTANEQPPGSPLGLSLVFTQSFDTSEFHFYVNDALITTDSVTATIAEGDFTTLHPDLADSSSITGSSTAAGSVSNLIDEDVTTHWQANSSATGYLDFDLTAAYTVYDLWLTSDNTLFARAPTEFTVYGSATGSFAGEETAVLSITGEANWTASERRKYRITTPTSYRYYRVEMTNTQSGTGSYALSEVSIYDSPWLDNSTGNGVVSITASKMYLDSDGGSAVVAEQKVAINELTSTHILEFNVDYGPVNIRIGASSGADDLAAYEDLRTGHHKISYDPDGNTNVYIQFYHSRNAGSIIDNVEIVSGTEFSIPHPYSASEMREIKYQQIGDVLYLCHPDYETRRLERRGHRSWSLTKNWVDGGPFDTQNTTPTTISASSTSGEVTLTATDDVFRTGDEGTLISLTDSGQIKQATGTALNDATDGIHVTGSSGAARTFNIQISGSFVGTVRLQESSGNENNYVNTSTTYTAAANVNYDDNKDNQDWYYRLIVESYTSGSITMKLTYSGGASTGIVRIVSITTPTSATAEVIEPVPSTDAIKTWKRSVWNATSGWPVAITQGFGRLWYGRGIKIWASVSDDFTNFAEGSEADDAFSVTLAQESSEGIRWLDFLGNIVIGTRTRETVGLGNTSSEPVGPTNFQTVPASEEGSGDVMPVRAEGSIVYVHRSLKRLMQFTQSPQALSKDSYTSIDLSELAPELLDGEVDRIAIQHEPQRRVFAVLKSGKLAELLFRREIEVTAWDITKTTGRVEDVCVLQQNDEDSVYMIVRRKVGGSWKRFVEKFGKEQIYTDHQRYHLDSALTRDLTRPDTIIQITDGPTTIYSPFGMSLVLAQAVSETDIVTVDADEAVFSSSDVGKRMWFPVGRGYVIQYNSTSQVLVRLTSPIDPDFGTDPVPSQLWGLASETTSVSGLDHLEGETVRVYADMKDHGTFTVSSGAITLEEAASIIHAGLPFESYWRSLKLAYGAAKGTAIGMMKSIQQLIAVLHKAGPTFRHASKKGSWTIVDTRDSNVKWGEPVPLFTGEKEGLNYDTRKQTDPRLHLSVDGPEPATVVGMVPQIITHDR